jgi:hypothetical protein
MTGCLPLHPPPPDWDTHMSAGNIFMLQCKRPRLLAPDTCMSPLLLPDHHASLAHHPVAPQHYPPVPAPTRPTVPRVTPSPSMTNPRSKQGLGKYILCDMQLFDSLDWEGLIGLQQGRGGLTNIASLQYPSKSLLQTLSRMGAPLLSLVRRNGLLLG